MDLAYDHIDQKAYAKKEDEPPKDGTKPDEPQSTLNDDFQQAYKAFSNSPWGARLGGFLGNVVKQGESVYTQAQKELAEVGEDASKGLTDLRATIVSHTRNLSLNTTTGGESSRSMQDGESTPTKANNGGSAAESSQQSETMLARLRSEAAKRLKDLQKAEDAADEALLKFGGNVRNFLRDAVSVAPPDSSDQSGTVLFESKDAQGKRVIHTSRFDAQLHVIHTSTESFAKDPTGPEFPAWAKDFDVDKKTPDIDDDLQKHPELRSTMEKLVPDQVPYADFWKRYYFLRHGIESAEARRRDLLKAAEAEDEVAWDDDDSEDEDENEKDKQKEKEKPKEKENENAESSSSSEDDSSDEESSSDDETAAATTGKATAKPASAGSSTTIHPPAQTLLKPNEARKSNDEKSQADSEASYDVVGATSGKTTQSLNSPKDSKKGDDSDDDWE